MSSHSKMSFLLDEWMEGKIRVPSLRSSDNAGWQTIPPFSHLFLLTRFYCSFLLLFCGSFGCWRLSQVWRQTLRDSTNFVFGEQLTWRWLSWRVKPRAELLYACTFLYVCVCVCGWMRILLGFKLIFITCRRLMCWSCEHLQKEKTLIFITYDSC